MTGTVLAAVAALVAVATVAGCTDADDEPTSPSPQAEPEPSRSPSGQSPEGGPADDPGTSPGSTAQARAHPVSLPALFDAEYDGRGLRLGRVLFRTDAYTQRFVTYRSGDLTISGIMDVPDGRGPFPVLVLGHGYIDPAVYVNGQGLRREQDWLARAGYVVLHTDYRNHAASDDDPRADLRLRLDYAFDMANAVLAVRRSRLPFLDGDRVGLLGRSMGGGVVYNVLAARPGLVDAAVVYSPVSSLAADNFNRWIRDDSDRSALSRRIIRALGTPERSPGSWRDASARTYFGRVTEPVLIHHGTADESCPIRWSRQTYRAMRRAGVDVRMFTYPGEPHAFVAAWPLSMRRTVRFFDHHLE